jgi:prevent-host-death family protein
MHTVNVHEAKTHLSRLLARVHAGEEVIIAKHGKPYALLCPLREPVPRRPGLLAGEVGDAFLEPLPPEELDAWES